MEHQHVSVLLEEVTSFWKNQGHGIYVDCTFGRGGHSKKLLKVIDDTSRLIAFDLDDDAIKVGEKLKQEDQRFEIYKANFKTLKNQLEQLNINQVDNILFDFGVSSPQFDDPNRGFSYHHDGPLDMRMDQDQKITAAKFIATAAFDELVNVFNWYGECQNSRAVAKKIIEVRRIQPITTTLQLVEIIKSALPIRMLHQAKHPCRTYFQAIRIRVNNELSNITDVLSQLSKIVVKNGVVVFLTFHSLEAKLIKDWIKKNTGQINLAGVPTVVYKDFCLLTKKVIVPDENQILINPRARSVKMWVVRKN